MIEDKDILVLYHDDADGFGAAWAAWRKVGDAARYHAVNYGWPAPDCRGIKLLYILDFCYNNTLSTFKLSNNFSNFLYPLFLFSRYLIQFSLTSFRSIVYSATLDCSVWCCSQHGCWILRYFLPISGFTIQKLIKLILQTL